MKKMPDSVIGNVVDKGSSRIMPLKPKESGPFLKVEVANHVLDSKK
ncbi:hypothetical protein ACSAZK_06500 [Methanosarcina sp. Mfa9]